MRVPQPTVLALSFIVAATSVAARPPQSATASTKQPAKPLTLSGCISASPNETGLFTLSDTKQGNRQGTKYKLVGTDVREYVGQHVEVSGVAPRRMQIVGGLYPSANIAAQAGAIDPNQAAIAAASGPAAGARPLVEFRVKSVRAIPGACPEQ
jgi:hypothetical protein